MYVDSHCHLSFPELSQKLPEIRAAMAAADVDRALCICTTLEEFERVHALALAYDNFWCSAGVHPDNEDVREPSVDGLVALAAKPRVVAIGETGLDYYRLGERSIADMKWQRQRFRVHIRAARATGLPLVIHTRSAPPTPSACCARRAKAARPACSTASPRPPRRPGPPSTSASSSRSRAS
jgi:TatD DNase family protein